jgi:flagellar motor component MotA
MKAVILILLAAAASLSGKLASFIDPYGLIFVLAGGVAMAMIGFPGAAIANAFAHAAGRPGSGAEIRRSALFWEAAARNVWMLGVLRSILNLVAALADQVGGIPAITTAMARSLLATFYGVFLAVVCFIPYWKLNGGLHGRSAPGDPGISEMLPRDGRGRWRFGAAVGYVLFFAVLISTLLKPSLQEIRMVMQWLIYWPAFLVVLGGTLALVLFVGKDSAAPMTSMAFAVTGLIGSLMGFIQALLGFANYSIAEVAAAVTLVLSSCFAALLGMLLVGAPMEDEAVCAGRISKPSVFSRAAWYVFPLVALIFLVLMFAIVVTPMTVPQK